MNHACSTTTLKDPVDTTQTAQRITWLALVLAVLLPFAVALVLVPFRTDIANANVALILAAAVVLVASLGRRIAAFVAAVSAFVWFDFFHTRPYESFRINSGDDLLTACVLLAVGLFVGELAVRSRYHQTAATESSNDIARIHSVAELVADGETADYLILVVANEFAAISCHCKAAGSTPSPASNRPPGSNETEKSSSESSAGECIPWDSPAKRSSSRSSATARSSAATCSLPPRASRSRSTNGSSPWPSPTKSERPSLRPGRQPTDATSTSCLTAGIYVRSDRPGKAAVESLPVRGSSRRAASTTRS